MNIFIEIRSDSAVGNFAQFFLAQDPKIAAVRFWSSRQRRVYSFRVGDFGACEECGSLQTRGMWHFFC